MEIKDDGMVSYENEFISNEYNYVIFKIPKDKSISIVFDRNCALPFSFIGKVGFDKYVDKDPDSKRVYVKAEKTGI